MNLPRYPARRAFLRLVGAMIAIPSAARSAGVDDPEPPRWLLQWSDARRVPVSASADPVVATLLDHARGERPLALFYHGGSRPGCMRRFLPISLFRHHGGSRVYVSGYCYQRQAPRILRVDRVAPA